MANRQQGSRQGKTSRKHVRPLNWMALGGLALVGIIVVALASQNGEPARVERFTHLHGLAVPSWAPDEVYVSTHQGLIRIDPEGDWRYVSEVRHDFMGFQTNPTEQGVLYSSGHPAPGSNLQNPLGFMVSRDRGETWRVMALAGQVDFHAMAVQPSNGDVIYGWSGGLYRSLDGGQTWEQRPAQDLSQVGGALSLAVHPQDAATLLAGTQRGLWRSADGGASWEVLLPDLPVTAVTYEPDDGESIYAYGAHTDAGLLRSEDGGASWRPLGFAVEGNDAVGYIALHPSDEGVMYLGSYGQDLFETIDGGQNWERLATRGVPAPE